MNIYIYIVLQYIHLFFSYATTQECSNSPETGFFKIFTEITNHAFTLWECLGQVDRLIDCTLEQMEKGQVDAGLNLWGA